MIIRPAEPRDIGAMEAVSIATDLGAVVPGTTGIPGSTHAAYLGHLIDRGRVAVAEDVGQVVGFGAAVETGRATHLADLFVLPDRQGQGVGRRLLAAVLGDARPLTTFASDDPRAMPLYILAGMEVYWPNLYLAGDPAGLPAAPGDLDVTDATLDEVADLERRWAGLDRSPDLPYWASLAGSRSLVVRRGERIVGAGFARDRLSGPGRWLDHAVIAPDADGPAALLALLRAGLAHAPIGGACVPGPSPLVRTLLEAGFTIQDRDTFMASDPSIVDPQREIVNTSLL